MAIRYKTADVWCRDLDYSILDPDGWRYENGMKEFFNKPITCEEFLQKMYQCTLQNSYEKKHEDRLREIAAAQRSSAPFMR